MVNSDTTKLLGNISAQKRLRNLPRENIPDGVFYTFPWDPTLNWIVKNFGPLYIPKKGDKVELNRTNTLLYRKIIEWEKDYSLPMIFQIGKRTMNYSGTV